VDFNSFLSLNFRPSCLELFLHFTPESQVLLVNLLDASFGMLLEQEEPESSLYQGCLLHEKLQLTVSSVSFVHAPVFLDSDGCKFGTTRSTKHAAWNLHMLDNILLVHDAIIKKLVRRFPHVVLLGEVNQLLALNVGKVNTVGREELLEQMNDEGY
jgi:hypothetical protein